MTIAFEINFQPKKDNSVQHFLLNLFSFYSEKYQQFNFLLVSNYEEINQISVLPNQQFITFQPNFVGKIKSFFLRCFLLEILLKRRNVTVLISNNSFNRKRKIKIKKFNWITDLSELKKVGDLSEFQHLFCINDYLKNKILVSRSTEAPFIHISKLTTFEKINPATFEQKEKIKQDYSNGNEYFLFYADHTTKIEEYISVMKAFSLFKKWQKSNMKLIVILAHSIENELSKLLESYKFREDLKLFLNDDNSKLLNLLSACYGCIINNNSCIQGKMINAIKLNIPVIVDESDFNKSSFENACVYSKIDEIQLSQKMILLYKDENFRDQIINETLLLSEKFNWDTIADNIWETISK